MKTNSMISIAPLLPTTLAPTAKYITFSIPVNYQAQITSALPKREPLV